MKPVSVSKKRKKEKFWSGSGKFFLTLLLVYLLYYGATHIFALSSEQAGYYTVADIEISGNHVLSRVDVLRLCNFASSSDSVFIETDRLAKQLIASKYVSGVSITKRPPRILNITLVERRPLAFIYGLGLNLIDKEAVLLPIPSKSLYWNLPLISGIRSRLGQLGKPALASDAYTAITILRYIQQNHPLLSGMISEVNMSDSRKIELYLQKGAAKVRISRDGYERELHILKHYLANYLNWKQLAQIEYIDLRFNNQLVIKKRV